MDISNSKNSANVAQAPAKLRTDTHIWGTYILLALVAVVELFSASIQSVSDGDIFSPIARQGAFLFAGLVIMIGLQKVHYRYIYMAIPIYVVLCVIALAVVCFFGVKINGARRGLDLGVITLLPADFLKLAVALGMTWILTHYRIRDSRGRGKRDVSTKGVVIAMCFLALCAALLFAQGLSNTIIVLAIGFSMMLVGGVCWKKIFICVLLVGLAGGGALYIKMTAKPSQSQIEKAERIAELNGVESETSEPVGEGRGSTWRNRLGDHFRPNKHKEVLCNDHLQEQLSHVAQARGGLRGVGPGLSRENARLPLADLDYIYAIVVEELGAVVGIFILIVYLWILGRSLALAMRFTQSMPAVLAMGCAFTIVFQALYHIAIVTGFLPVSGQPLPLISKGGVSVLATSMAFGIMLSVARHAVRTTDGLAEIKQEIAMLPDKTAANNPVLSEPSKSNGK